MNREDNLCWFHGKLSRERAEQILRDEGVLGDGVFLVRESSSAFGDYVLSVLHIGEVWHYQIRRHGEDAFFSIDDQTTIHGLDSLIEHYREASHGLVTQLKAIVKSDPPPNDSRSHGRTNLLHRATKEGNLVVVSELLKCGYRNIDAKNQDGQTAVHLVSKFGNEQILKMLIDSGAIVNLRDSDGNTPLHYACRNNKPENVRLLVDAKANVTARNNETGCVPMHDAAKEGQLEIVKELLSLNAPHMPRSNFGEFPIDYARDSGHTEIIDYLKKYNPPPAISHKFKWYHGTLDRNEAAEYLREFSQNMTAKQNVLDPQQPSTSSSIVNENYSSGVYLVRCSDRNNGNYVLTLLFEDQPKNYVIQENLNYMYIDEGPYMTSLEHLIQHYINFADGLPINLKYPVPPKPKPPIPLFSTIPKTKRSVSTPYNFSNGIAMSPPSSDSFNNNNILRTVDADNNQFNKRNLSVPNDSSMINKQGIWDISPNNSPPPPLAHPKENAKSPKSSSDMLNFRSLKLKPKRNIIIDGMKSLTKSKSKHNKEDAATKKNRNSVENFEQAQQMMQNLSFSTDFLNTTTGKLNGRPDEFYNVPQNNCAIVDIDLGEIGLTSSGGNHLNSEDSSEILDNDNSQPDDHGYYTVSDKTITHHDMADKDEENIYFIDAPKIITNYNTTSSTPPMLPPLNIINPANIKSNQNNNNNFIFNTAGYVVTKNIPMFFDNPITTQTKTTPERTKPSRLQSIISTVSSQRSESEYNTIVDQQTIQQHQQNLLKHPNYFISAENLVLLHELGKGEFGSVYRGLLQIPNIIDENGETAEDNNGNIIKIPVAIKTLHDEHCKENRVEFLREAHVMMQLRHHCIVNMIGISKGPPLRMVQELEELGSMLDYIQNNPEKLTTKFELKVWASQIACGMNYLESQHFVHRDLAARNILLASIHQAKISDFGLSRALGAGSDYYQASQGGKWPIKWYAPESFNFGTFSHSSDVWSFGVTLWEMFSIGQPPYGEMKGVDVIKMIETGKRLIKPELCDDKVFTVIESCWNYNPKKRPTFKQLTEFFSNDPDYQNLTEMIRTEDIS